MDVVARGPHRDEVWLVDLDPTRGAEIQKIRPCLVVSPDEINEEVLTVIIAPLTSTIRSYPTRVSVRFQGKNGQIALDQLRSVDRRRLVRRLGTVADTTAQSACAALVEMFTRN
jgi:mRNA interferase MazF